MRESQGLGFAGGKMASRVSSGFRHLRREPDVMLTSARAVSSRSSRQPNTFDAKVVRIPLFGDSDIWINAFAANESAVAPRDPAEIIKSAAVKALSKRVAEGHFPAD